MSIFVKMKLTECKVTDCVTFDIPPCIGDICTETYNVQFDVSRNRGVRTERVNFRIYRYFFFLLEHFLVLNCFYTYHQNTTFFRSGECLTEFPTRTPTLFPSFSPTYTPTAFPTINPSITPTALPTRSPIVPVRSNNTRVN